MSRQSKQSFEEWFAKVKGHPKAFLQVPLHITELPSGWTRCSIDPQFVLRKDRTNAVWLDEWGNVVGAASSASVKRHRSAKAFDPYWRISSDFHSGRTAVAR